MALPLKGVSRYVATLFMTVIILHTAQFTSSSPSKKNGVPVARVMLDAIQQMKMRRPQNGSHLQLDEAEFRRLAKEISESEHLDKLRELSKRLHPGKRSLDPEPDWPWKVDPDVYRNMSGLVWSKGYPIEEYEVQTADGYILGLFRIPHGKNNTNSTASRPPVFLQHGLLASSTNWVENLANQSLGFILADAGYDVWMGNVRGNTYSRKHVSLDPKNKEFWQFSWDDMAKYDIPAMVDFVLEKSGQSQLAYVGHSQGTLVAFTGFAENKELAKKISTIFALGPVYTVGNISSIFQDLVDSGLAQLIADILYLLGADDFLPQNFVINELQAETLCACPKTSFICEQILFIFGGYSQHHMNVSRVQVYISNAPAGTSLQNVEHFLQMVESDKCQKFDYGPIQNMIKYNQTKPPEYHVEDLTVNVALFWGDNDRLADPTDVKALIPRIPHLVYNKEISNFEHLDFIWAMDAKSILYDDILRIMQGSSPLHRIRQTGV